MNKSLLLLMLLSFHSFADGSEPVWLDWNSLTASTDNIKVSARVKEDQSFEYFKIKTEHGEFEIDQKAKKKITKPILKTIRIVVFPLTIDASEVEYHVQLYYEGRDFDKREDACWEIDGHLSGDFARIRLSETGIKKIEYQKGKCDKVDA